MARKKKKTKHKHKKKAQQRPPRRRVEVSPDAARASSVERPAQLEVNPPRGPRERLQHRTSQLRSLRAVEGGKSFSEKTKSWWARVKAKSDQLWAWYQGLPTIQRVLLGLVVIPIVAVIVLINLILIPMIAPLLPLIGAGLITLAKLTFVVTKFSAFAVYIGYKVLKTFLGFYYCVSRSLSGLKAGKLRAQLNQAPLDLAQARAQGLQIDERLAPVSCVVRWKRLTLSAAEGEERAEHPLLFSYFRYFLLGQLHMYVESWRERRSFLTIWRPESRERVKDQFAFVGTTIFRPYSLGPHLTRDRALLPGDARLCAVRAADDGLTYDLEVPWRAWRFNRSWPFAHSELYQARWSITLPRQLSALEGSALKWRTDAVLEEGGPVVEDTEDQVSAEGEVVEAQP